MGVGQCTSTREKQNGLDAWYTLIALLNLFDRTCPNAYRHNVVITRALHFTWLKIRTLKQLLHTFRSEVTFVPSQCLAHKLGTQPVDIAVLSSNG